MKNTMHKMKKILAALLAAACLPVAGLTARADVDWYWGNTTWDAVSNLEPFDNHGAFDYTFYDGTRESVKYHPSYFRERDTAVIVLEPCEKNIRIVLREETPYAEANPLIYQAVKKFQKTYQETHDGATIEDYNINSVDDLKTYELRFVEIPENADEIEAGILYELAKEHLITEFYGFGATARYTTVYYYGLLSLYRDSATVINEEWFDDHTQPWTIEHEVDYDAVQAFLDENYPGYKVEEYLTGSYEAEQYGYSENTKFHRVVPSEELTPLEKMELDCVLSEHFHIGSPGSILESPAEQTLGHNALENKGDVTLDLELDIMDVIAANKAILGSYSLCDTARKNADISGDGTPDETDSLAILKEVVGITEGFVEQ